jgi:hypothetical protein
MKTNRRVFREGRHERSPPWRDDSYRNELKYDEPTKCPDCGASFVSGRWTWDAPAEDASEQRCPACERIHDDFPGGHIILRGAFAQEHRDEIIATVRNCESREKAEHPLQRIMGIAEKDGYIEVTTTDAHLARGIAHALRAAYDGQVRMRFAREENFVRAVWQR